MSHKSTHPALEQVDINDWIIIDLVKGEKADKEEIETMYDSVLQKMEGMMVQELEEGQVSALGTSDEETEGYYLVKWTENPVMAEEDTELEDGTFIKQGQYICKGIYLYEVPGANHWYTEKDVTEGVPINFPVDHAVRFVVLPYVEFEIEDGVDVKLPNSMRNHIKTKARQGNCRHLTDDCHRDILKRIDRRERLENKVAEGQKQLNRQQEAAAQEVDIISSEEDEEDDSSEEGEEDSD